MARKFTARVTTAAEWKHSYFGAAYSSRIKAAIAELREAIAEAEAHPEIGAGTFDAAQAVTGPCAECKTLEVCKKEGCVIHWRPSARAQPSRADEVLVTEDMLKAARKAYFREGVGPYYSDYAEIYRAMVAAAQSEAPRSSAATEQEITSIVSRLRNFAVWNNRQSHYEPVPLCKEAADLIERIRAVPQEAWQPIETAPRDGTPIEACNTRHPDSPPVIVRWDADGMSEELPEPHWCDAATKAGEALYYNQNYFDFWKPTTPLPRPQSRGGAEG
jgi:hypothetical protein